MTTGLRRGFMANRQLGRAAGFSGRSQVERATIERDNGVRYPALAPLTDAAWGLACLERYRRRDGPDLVEIAHAAESLLIIDTAVRARPDHLADESEADPDWNQPGAICDRVIGRSGGIGIAAYFCGHLHQNANQSGTPFEMVATSAVGLPLGDDPSGLRIVEVEAGAVTHRFVSLDELDRGVRP